MPPARRGSGARGGTRTRTPFPAADFESAVSAIPPPGPGARISLRVAVRRFGRSTVGRDGLDTAADAEQDDRTVGRVHMDPLPGLDLLRRAAHADDRRDAELPRHERGMADQSTVLHDERR